MITRMPSNDTERAIRDIIKNHELLTNYSEGEKAIIYDLAIVLPSYYHFNWSDILLRPYVHNIIISYDKNKNKTGLDVVCACLNNIFREKIFYIDGGMYSDKKIIVSKDKSISNKKSGGTKNDKNENSSSE